MEQPKKNIPNLSEKQQNALLEIADQILKPFFDSGRLTYDLQPSPELSYDQIVTLAKDMAERFVIEDYHFFLDEIWLIKP